MARIRSLKPEFWTSEQVMECSPIARLAFVGMWNFCDDRGVHPASTKTLKAEIFPGDDISEKQVRGLVQELIDQGLLIEYESSGKRYWSVTGWHHQKIDKPTYKHPPPPNTPQLLPDNSSNGSRVVGDSSPPEGKGVESTGEDGMPPPVGDAPAPKERKKRDEVTLAAYLAQCESDGVKPVPEDDSVFGYAEKVGICEEMLTLAWVKFKAYWCQGEGRLKRRKDWRQTFGNAVAQNRDRLWFIRPGERAQWTTVGEQARRVAA